MKGWELSHSVVEKIHKVNLSKDALERTLGVVIGMLIDGEDLEDIASAGKIILALRQPRGIEGFLVEMKKVDEKNNQRKTRFTPNAECERYHGNHQCRTSNILGGQLECGKCCMGCKNAIEMSCVGVCKKVAEFYYPEEE